MHVFDDILQAGHLQLLKHPAVWQNCLEATIASLAGRTTGGIPHDKIQFVAARVFGLCRGLFTGKQPLIAFAFAPGPTGCSGHAGGHTSIAGHDGHAHELQRLHAVFQLEGGKVGWLNPIDNGPCLRRPQAAHGLAHKLVDLHRDADTLNTRKTHADIAAHKVAIAVQL